MWVHDFQYYACGVHDTFQKEFNEIYLQENPSITINGKITNIDIFIAADNLYYKNGFYIPLFSYKTKIPISNLLEISNKNCNVFV